jgi:hypothetical protein
MVDGAGDFGIYAAWFRCCFVFILEMCLLVCWSRLSLRIDAPMGVCAEIRIYVAGSGWSSVCRCCGCFWPFGILIALFFRGFGCWPDGSGVVLVGVVPKRVVCWKWVNVFGVAWMIGRCRALNVYPGYLASETCQRLLISM